MTRCAVIGLQTTHELLSETTCGVLRELVFVRRIV